MAEKFPCLATNLGALEFLAQFPHNSGQRGICSHAQPVPLWLGLNQGHCSHVSTLILPPNRVCHLRHRGQLGDLREKEFSDMFDLAPFYPLVAIGSKACLLEILRRIADSQRMSEPFDPLQMP